jgi:cation diffusion facilitator family transporter
MTPETPRPRLPARVAAHPDGPPGRLAAYAGLSIATALVTMALKVGAARLTGSVGLLSDALEAGVNLVAALIVLAALLVAARPPDASHEFGHGKAEYLSAAAEGLLVLGAAALIVVAALIRLAHPQELERLGFGLAVGAVAAALNLGCAVVLWRAGARHRSMTLGADARHLLVDVLTSVGVIGAVVGVWVTGWRWLDPAIAFAVALNVLVIGWRMLRRSIGGLMDQALSPVDHATIHDVLAGYTAEGVRFRDLRTREAGRRRFVAVDVLVPGAWTVRRGHDLVDRLEADLAAVLPGVTVLTHLEPAPEPGPVPVVAPVPEPGPVPVPVPASDPQPRSDLRTTPSGGPGPATVGDTALGPYDDPPTAADGTACPSRARPFPPSAVKTRSSSRRSATGARRTPWRTS